MALSAAPLTSPQTSIALERYYSPSANRHWATSSLAVPESGTWDFQDELRLGGVFTTGGTGLIELDDCVAAGEDYFDSIDQTGGCEGQTKLRVAGFVYSAGSPQPAGTHAIYRCLLSSGDHFTSVSSTCEGSGATMEGALGYVLE